MPITTVLGRYTFCPAYGASNNVALMNTSAAMNFDFTVTEATGVCHTYASDGIRPIGIVEV